MLFLALGLTLIGGLTVARHFVEPACPSCSAKNWRDQPAVLECANCGWTTVPAAAPVVAEAPAAP